MQPCKSHSKNFSWSPLPLASNGKPNQKRKVKHATPKVQFQGGEGFLARPRAIFVVWTPKFFGEDFRIYEVSLMWVKGQHPHQKFFSAG